VIAPSDSISMLMSVFFADLRDGGIQAL